MVSASVGRVNARMVVGLFLASSRPGKAVEVPWWALEDSNLRPLPRQGRQAHLCDQHIRSSGPISRSRPHLRVRNDTRHISGPERSLHARAPLAPMRGAAGSPTAPTRKSVYDRSPSSIAARHSAGKVSTAFAKGRRCPLPKSHLKSHDHPRGPSGRPVLGAQATF
jgi:hypothetical protein